ncbi:MAG: protein kinase domain-containing protein [Bryobacteraceae bacterium]
MNERAQWDRIESIFHDALERRDPFDRAEYISRMCAGDDDLRKRIESLLDSDNQASPVDKSPISPMPERILGNYRLVSKLAEGGMGTVYLARDMRLDREVALKILSAEFTQDAERKRRFVREAKAASALNHPNIVTVHDFGTCGELDYLVMEYVAGKPLDRLIPRNGLKLKEALRYGIQIADALRCAHKAGIIHRDLKPGNVVITESGVPKVLDFGIAKQTRAEPPPDSIAPGFENAGTLTQHGLILGTVAYMSPEQADGRPVDARSDIFSFGSLLYEMVTGRQAFQRDTAASTIAALLRENPQSASALVEDVPPELEGLIGLCLRKNPADRYQHIDDVKLALEQIKEKSYAGVLTSAAKTQRRHGRFVWGAGLVAVLLLVSVGVWFVRSKTRAPEASLVAVPLTSDPGIEYSPSFSPDGTQVAFEWCKDTEGKNCNIYVKQIGVELPFRLTATRASEFSPAWSPDGRFIAYLRELSPGKSVLLVIPQRGGRERVLADVAGAFMKFLPGPYLAWAPDSKWIAFATGDPVASLSLISVDTQEERRLTTLSSGGMGDGDTTPAFSPDGRTLAFARFVDKAARADLYVVRLAGGYTAEREPVRLPPANGLNIAPAWTPDGREIVFSSGYSPGGPELGLWRTAVTEQLKPSRLPFAPNNSSTPAISRQLNRLAYVEDKSDTNIWRIDLRDPGSQPSTPVPFIASTRLEVTPAFSPDGKRIAFASNRSGTEEIWVCDGDGSNPVQLTSFGGQTISGPQWSWDSQNIAFWATTKEPGVYIVSVNGGVPRRLTTLPAGGKWPFWSRDGQSLYFVGGGEIWKMRSTGGGAVQITRNKGDVPQQSPDGKFVYYSKGWPLPLSVWKMPVEGGEETKVLDSVNPSTLWTVGTKGIYFFTTADDKGRSDLCLYEFATSKTTKVLTVERSVDFGLAVSPDGGSILYTQLDEAGSNLMLVENFK